MTTATYPGPAGLDNLIALPFARAAEVAKVTKRQLWYWDLTNLVRPRIRRGIGRTSKRLYALDDMVALLVTARMRERGFSLQHIRRVVAHLQSRGYNEPLTNLRFATLASEIYFQHTDGTWEGDRSPDQIVITEVIDLDHIRKVVRRGVSRPARLLGRTQRQRGHLGGKETFAGTRIPVETVLRRLREGATVDDLVAAYPGLTKADIETAHLSQSA